MSIKNLILFGFALLDETMREFRDPAGFTSFSYKNLYGFIPESYKRRSIYNTINKLKSNGGIISVRRGNFEITSKGKNEILVYFPKLQFINKPWDGKWRIVGFDVEEEKKSLRNSLRRSLCSLGFGMLQRSLYVSPLPVEKIVEDVLSSNRNRLDNAYIFISDKFFLGNDEDFVDKVFHVRQLNNAYGEFLEKLELKTNETGNILRDFLKLSEKDPFLPKELLPKDFVRQKVWGQMRVRGII